MKWKLLWSAAFLIVVCCLASVWVYLGRQAAQRRTAANRVVIEAALRRLSAIIPLGATRIQVKKSLRTQGVSFSERCCFEPGSPFSIAVKVGQEENPWYCGEWSDYVEFEFSSTEAPHRLDILESDILKLIHLTSNGEGCL